MNSRQLKIIYKLIDLIDKAKFRENELTKKCIFWLFLIVLLLSGHKVEPNVVNSF